MTPLPRLDVLTTNGLVVGISGISSCDFGLKVIRVLIRVKAVL